MEWQWQGKNEERFLEGNEGKQQGGKEEVS